jgi:hypothetical protein
VKGHLFLRIRFRSIGIYFQNLQDADAIGLLDILNGRFRGEA